MNKETIFCLPQSALKKGLKKELRKMGYEVHNENGFLYAEGTVPVLLVAHLDTVHKMPVETICKSDNGDIWMSPEGIGGDDRCGVYAVLEIVKHHNCHVLFCEDEEIGGVGASRFARSEYKPNVNYCVEFDRKGSNDAVFYDCENDEFEDFVESFGFEYAWGSFSDISEVAPALGVAAVNISSGYYNAHTTHEYVVWSELEHNVERVCEMISTQTDKFKYIPAKRYIKSSWTKSNSDKVSNIYSSYYTYDDYDYEPESSACEIWEEDLSPFTGTVVDYDGNLLESGFDDIFLINERQELFRYEDGMGLLVPYCEPYLLDGVTFGFNKSKAKKYICMEEDYYYEWAYSGEVAV